MGVGLFEGVRELVLSVNLSGVLVGDRRQIKAI
jgi:hypothetical protein